MPHPRSRHSALHATITVFLFAAFTFVTGAQEPTDRGVIAKIRDEGLTRSRAGEMFDTLTTVYGPRLTGSPEYKRSAEWARDRLKEWGLENPRLDAWEFGRGWAVDRFVVELTEPRYAPLLAYPDGWSPPTSGELVATPIYLGDRSVEQVEAMRASGVLKGAIVLSQPIVTNFIREDRVQPTDPSATPAAPTSPPAAPAQGGARGRGPGGGQQRLTQLFKEAGVAAILRPSRGMHGTVFVTGRDGGADDRIARVVVSAEHYNMLVRMVQRGLPVKLRLNVQARFLTDDTNGYNVLAELPGTDPALKDEVVMLGAHLDSWHTATGATDNADGSAIVLEVMRILKTIGARPRRTIRMALWGGEEEGLHGSRRYVEKYLAGDDNRAARDRMSMYLNIDPGSGPIYGFFMEKNEAAARVFDAWLEPFKDLGARRNVMQGIGSTDHLSFIRAGIPGFNPVQDYVDYDVRTHHTNVDTAERIREQDLKQAAVILAAFAYHAAIRNEKIPRPAPSNPQ